MQQTAHPTEYLERATLLNQINTSLANARSESDILAAIAPFASRFGPAQLLLHFVDTDEAGSPTQLRVVSTIGNPVLPNGQTFPVSEATLKLLEACTSEDANDQPAFFNDFDTDPRVADSARAIMHIWGMRSGIMLPLRTGKRWQALMGVTFADARAITAEEHDIYTQLLPTLAAIVTTRRALLSAQEAKEEATLLYRLAGRVNSAVSHMEIVQALSILLPDADAAYLAIPDHTYTALAANFSIVHMQMNGSQAGQVTEDSIPVAAFPITFTMRDNRLYVIEDVMTDPRVDPVSRTSLAEVMGMQATLACSFNPEDDLSRVLGGFGFRYAQPRVFSDGEKRLILAARELLMAAFDRIRLQRETELARRETEHARSRAEIVARVTSELARARDEAGILTAIATLTSIPDGCYSSLHFASTDMDGNLGFQMKSNRHPGGKFADTSLSWFKVIFRASEWPGLHWMEQHPETILHVTGADEMRVVFGESAQKTLDLGWRTAIIIPLWADNVWYGAVQLLWMEEVVISDDLLQIIETLRPVLFSVVTARQAIISAELARHEIEQRANELATVAKVSAAATTLLEEARLLQEFTALTRTHFAPHEITLYLADGTKHLRPVASVSDDPDDFLDVDGECLAARAMRERRGLISHQMVQELLTGMDNPQDATGLRTTSELAAPLVVRDSVIGVLLVRAPYGTTMGESQLRVMSTLADLIAVAIQNSRSYRQGKELAALQERTRLSRELHDSVSQALYGIALGATTARAQLDKDPALAKAPLDYVVSLTQAGLTEMRTLIFDLRPDSLEKEGLITALSKQGGLLEARHGIRIVSEMCDEPNLPLETKESLYRVAREALHNVMKHAQASTVVIRLEEDEDEVQLDIVDDGRGFDPNESFTGHLGLQSMRERMKALGGQISITSEAGAGTHVSVRLPL